MSEENISASNPPSGEPTAARSTAPMWIIVVTLTLLFVGFVFFDKNSGWFDSKVYGPYSSTEEVESWQPKSGAQEMAAIGKAKYEQFCGICHGMDGNGKPGQAPPLAGSEWVNAKGVNRLTHIPLAGLLGPIKVEGKDWNLNMAAMGMPLSDEQLAAVLTYIRASWGNKSGEVTADEVKKVRDAVAGHAQPLNGDQLEKMPE